MTYWLAASYRRNGTGVRFEAAMQLKIDHVTICGADLSAMRQAFAAVGLATSYGGPHANGVTHMDLLAFADGSYLELIAPMARGSGVAGMMGGWGALMEGNAGCGAWAARSSAIRSDAERLRGRGIGVRGPEPGSRKRPDGAVLAWEIAVLGPGTAGAVLPFLIQDKTPRELRVPAPADGIVPWRGIASVVLGVRDRRAAIDLFHRGCDLEHPRIERHEEFGAELAHFSGTPVILATPLDERCWLHLRLERFGECPAAFLLTAADFSEAKHHFAHQPSAPWFGRKLAWFDEDVLGARIGVIE